MAERLNTLDEETRRVVEEFGEDLIAEIQRLLREEDKVATGTLLNSFRWEAVETARELNYHLSSTDYFTYVDQGRGPGKQPPLQDIIGWTRVVGIPRSAAFPIARNIGKFGIPATNILQRSVRATADRFEDRLSEQFRTKIINIVDESAKSNT